jgi:HlyD family secretion protein
MKKKESEPIASGEAGRGQTGKKRRKWLILVAVVLVLAVAFFALRMMRGGRGRAVSAELSYQEEPVAVRTISQSMTGTGTLKPANSYTVTTLVSGSILEADFEEGDMVEEGQQLYLIDSSAIANNSERSEISLSQAQRNYEKTEDLQYARTTIDGVVHSLNVAVGDTVTAGQEIALVRDTSSMLLKLSFPAQDAANFRAGQSAEVTLDGTFETLAGVVSAVSGVDAQGSDNLFVRTVTIKVANPGYLTLTQAASACIDGVYSTGSALFTYLAEETVTASAGGTVMALYVQEGSHVNAKDALLMLGGDDLTDQILNASESLRSAELASQSAQEELEKYTITSPISGSIVEKDYKQGDKAEGGKTLCVIYDLSYLEMTINVDELDINSIQVGQTVRITADAVAGQVYQGVVTRVSVAGSAAQNSDYYYGTTTSTYPVTVRIDETDGLLPGMNANAEIVIAEADDVLTVPNGAVQRGNYVLVTADSPSAANAVPEEESGLQAPDGYVYVAVELGFSDDDYAEIRGGLTEEDVVAYTMGSAQSDDLYYGGGYYG